MSLFPLEDINVSDLIKETVTTLTEFPLAEEYAWDFENNDFLLVDGKNVIVTGKEAVKVWVWKVLQTKKYKYRAYTSNYGNELESFINQGFSTGALKSEVERYLKESLLVNKYITGVKNIDMTIDGSKTDVRFTVTTIYGEVSVSSV